MMACIDFFNLRKELLKSDLKEKWREYVDVKRGNVNENKKNVSEKKE